MCVTEDTLVDRQHLILCTFFTTPLYCDGCECGGADGRWQSGSTMKRAMERVATHIVFGSQ